MTRHTSHGTTLASSIIVLSILSVNATGASNPFADQPKADDVFYHIMPITWRDGPDSDAVDPNRFGDFVGMREGLPYLEDLGVTAVWMNPIFPSPAYHGYQHGRADQVNPRFGTEAQFFEFVDDAHDRSIEVYLDFVVYGISHDATWFQSAFNNPASIYDDWLAFNNGSNTDYLGSVYNTWNGDSVGFIHWDLRNPDTRDLVIDWSEKWLDPNNDGDPSDGIDGYRLDHVWVNYGSGPDGWGYNLDDFWADWHTALRDVNPEVFTFAEQHNWGSHGAEYLTQFDAAMTKPFEFAARSAIADANPNAIEFQMEETIRTFSTVDPDDRGTYVAIIGDHDVNRLASSINASSEGNIGRAEVAAAVLMLQPFPPIIYAGDEIAMLGIKQDYGSDANDIPMREPFKWNAVESAPMSRYHRLNTQAFVNQFSQDNDGRSVEEQSNSGVLQRYKDLIALRHDNVALRRGSYHLVNTDNQNTWAFMRIYEQGEAPIPDQRQALLCAVNFSGSPQSVTAVLPDFIPEGTLLEAVDLVTGDPIPMINVEETAMLIEIPGYGCAVIEADFQRPPAPPVVIDGRIDDSYKQVATSSGGSIWASFDGDVLALATEPAGDGRDRFVLIAETPGDPVPAVWAKSGTIAEYDAFMGNEADNNWSGWFLAFDLGIASGEYLEGAIDLRAQYGTIPETIDVAALSYFTNNGDPLDPALQVPSGNGDSNVQANEFVTITLSDLLPCRVDIDQSGSLDFGDVSAFLTAFASNDLEVDFDNSGTLDFGDVSTFLTLFAAGCP